MRVTPGNTVLANCLTNAIDDETLGPWVDVRGCANITFYQSSTGTTSGGTIVVEECAPKDIDQEPPIPFGAGTGDYSAIGSASNASDTSAGKQKAIHITNAAYFFVRARVATAITGGGSVTVGLVAY